MTVAEIIAYANQVSNQSIDNTFGIATINDAMEKLALMYDAAKLSGNTSTINCTNIRTWYDLPSDYIGAYRLVNSGGNEIVEYEVRDNVFIKFYSTETYTLYYYSLHPEVTLVTETPGINSLYHRAIGYYIAYKYTIKKDPSNPRANPMLDTFEQRIEQANASILGSKRRHRRLGRGNVTY